MSFTTKQRLSEASLSSLLLLFSTLLLFAIPWNILEHLCQEPLGFRTLLQSSSARHLAKLSCESRSDMLRVVSHCFQRVSEWVWSHACLIESSKTMTYIDLWTEMALGRHCSWFQVSCSTISVPFGGSKGSFLWLSHLDPLIVWYWTIHDMQASARINNHMNYKSIATTKWKWCSSLDRIYCSCDM